MSRIWEMVPALLAANMTLRLQMFIEFAGSCPQTAGHAVTPPAAAARCRHHVRIRYGIAFDNIGHIFHEASWEPAWAYGLASSVQPPYGSHGCVHMPRQQLGAMYGWVRIGASVYIN